MFLSVLIRAVYGLTMAILSIVTAISLRALLGYIPIVNAAFFVVLLCAVWALLGNAAWRELIICRMVYY